MDWRARTPPESEERFKAIVDTTPECIKIIAPDGTVLHMNASGLVMVGAPYPEAVIGKNVYDLIAPEFRAAFREFNQRICSGEKGLRLTMSSSRDDIGVGSRESGEELA